MISPHEDVGTRPALSTISPTDIPTNGTDHTDRHKNIDTTTGVAQRDIENGKTRPDKAGLVPTFIFYGRKILPQRRLEAAFPRSWEEPYRVTIGHGRRIVSKVG